MKRLFIIVEGQTEQEFVKEILSPYLQANNIHNVVPILINTSKIGRGGFVNYKHLENTINGLLHQSPKNDFIVTTFVDFFRIPKSIPKYSECMSLGSRICQVNALENAISEKIGDNRFIPYIQLHEFEALLFSNNNGFEYFYDEIISSQTNKIINQYRNPEDINTTPNGAPSKRILAIKKDYDKVIEGNLIAMEVGINSILKECPRFKSWIDNLIQMCRDI
ncbi:MAG: DUF4276 family protein [Muribaculaceae bacterium]